MKKNLIIQVLINIFVGIIIGAGAILPGISGGVLAVVFGLYRPVMELISKPKYAAKKYWKMLLPAFIGWGFGFIYGSRLVNILFDFNENAALSLFFGLVAGTLPSLWKEAGIRGRNKYSYLSCVLSFLIMTVGMIYVRFGKFYSLPHNFFGFAFCGILWGLSLIVPGMTSSSILMSVGIFDSMTAGISSFDMSVLIPWVIGMLAAVLTFARLVSKLFEKHYPTAFHCVFGIVVASTVTAVPVKFSGAGEFFICLASAVFGAVISWFLSRIRKVENQ